MFFQSVIILAMICFTSINVECTNKYRMIVDVEDAEIVPAKPLEVNYDINDLFRKEAINLQEYDLQVRKHGKVMSKAYSMPEHCRNLMANSFTKYSNQSLKIHHQSTIALKVYNKIIALHKIPREKAYEYLGQITVPKEFCPYAQKLNCDPNNRYRTYDGSCNNLNNPWYGKTETPLKRLWRPRYHDSMNEATKLSVLGIPLPNPRMVAYTALYPMDIDIEVNSLTVFWGQFIDHDMSLTALISGPDGKPKACTCDGNDPDCINIPIPETDPVYKRQKCMVTPRSSASFPKFDCKLGVREQINVISHWLDLSHVYGVTLEENAKVRLGTDGLLKAVSIPGQRYEHLPLEKPNSGRCTSEKTGSPCFMGVEKRMNQNLALLSLHTVWLREHNRIARVFKHLNQHWDDERIFQHTRRIMVAIYQHITYKHWLPVILGKEITRLYDCVSHSDNDYFYGYEQKVNPHISNEFATAAFRFGHSLVGSWVVKSDVGLKLMSNVTLIDHFLNTAEAFKDYGLDGVLRGCLIQKATAGDGHITAALNDHLFRNPDKNAETHQFSLGSLNINRNRDHALPPYTTYRKMCGLSVPKDFDDMNNLYSDSMDGVKKAYAHVDDIDLFTGGMSEKPVKGGLVGPVFASIIAKQFRDLKYGDRYYYENGHDKNTRFSLEELGEIRKVTISRILCDNIDIAYVPRNPWLVDSSNNPVVDCESLPKMDLSVFRG